MSKRMLYRMAGRPVSRVKLAFQAALWTAVLVILIIVLSISMGAG